MPLALHNALATALHNALATALHNASATEHQQRLGNLTIRAATARLKPTAR